MNTIFHHRSSILALTCILVSASAACSVTDGLSDGAALDPEAPTDSSALLGGKDTNGVGTGPSSYFHTAALPPQWLPWTTDGAAPIEAGPAFLSHGLRCRGDYCDDVSLLAVESGHTQAKSWWTDYFSEEGAHEQVCADNGFVTGIRCSGRYCDNVSLRCSKLDNNVRTGCYWTAPVSDEGGGTFVAPQSMYIAGARCAGRYCDESQLFLCQADSGGPSFDMSALATTFAPRLRFDQETGSGSGEQNKCFPSDPGAYVTARAQGANPTSLCNKDYATIQNNQVPIYYMANQVGTNAVLIRYWFFYAWQSTCFVTAGSHAADWESMAVLIVDGTLKRVAFYQHGGWYSREPGNFETVNGTHPIGYAGKNAHGTFHDAGGSGGCLYFEDFRNAGSKDYHMDTWNNLVLLARGGSAPWMNCQGSGCFDGVGHPIEQTGDLHSMGGCGKDGCSKSSLVSNMPFINAL